MNLSTKAFTLTLLLILLAPGVKAFDVPTNVILKTDFKTWEINPRRLDLLSEYKKTNFGGLSVSLNETEGVDLDGLISKSTSEGFDMMKIRGYLQSVIAPDINREATSISIDLDEEGRVVFDGTGLYGRTLDVDAAAQMFKYALENNLVHVNLPLITQDPEVEIKSDTLKEMGITEFVSAGETDFSGSPYNRTVNIDVGLSKFEGHIVKPGEEFVFGGILGEVDGNTGYKKELVIKGDKTVPEYGGGLCQVSTTAYRAVLAAGYPITERRNHSYAVDYYQPLGLDATVYPPSIEMKFLNDTPHHILMQSFIQGTNSHYNFYGTKTNRTVRMIGPYYSKRISPPPDRIEYTEKLAPGETQILGHAKVGVNTTWYRHVTYNDQSIENSESKVEEPKTFLETIYSRYQARPNYYLIGKEKEGFSNEEIGG